MAWTIEFARSAEKELSKLDRPVAQRILRFLRDRVVADPRSVGEPLKGDLAGFWRYRIGDYRVYADLQDDRLIVLIVKLGHRRNVYRSRQ